jgi:hypothetical protein
MYSLYDTILANVRDVDDEINSVASGLLTGKFFKIFILKAFFGIFNFLMSYLKGVTYRSPHGLRAMTKGGAVGLGLTLAYLGYTKRDLVMSSLNLNKNV